MFVKKTGPITIDADPTKTDIFSTTLPISSLYDIRDEDKCVVKGSFSIVDKDYWKQVRHIPKDLSGWDPRQDKLLGTEEYGEYEDSSDAWAMKF